jgi:hypothetical protein
MPTFLTFFFAFLVCIPCVILGVQFTDLTNSVGTQREKVRSHIHVAEAGAHTALWQIAKKRLPCPQSGWANFIIQISRPSGGGGGSNSSTSYNNTGLLAFSHFTWPRVPRIILNVRAYTRSLKCLCMYKARRLLRFARDKHAPNVRVAELLTSEKFGSEVYGENLLLFD